MQSKVSILTPTANRHSFFPKLIEYVRNQTYPLKEWIIYDDGIKPVESLLEPVMNELNIIYHYDPVKKPIGFKRNWLNDHAKGEYLIYFDDDDIHRPKRIEHSIQTLLNSPDFDVAGNSAMLMTNGSKTIVTKPRFNHCTAGTMCFRKILTERRRFHDEATVAEEKYFLRGLNIVQLNPYLTIICVSHKENTYDKTRFF